MLLFTIQNYFVFLPLCIVVFFIISFYVSKHKKNKVPIMDVSLEEEYKEARNDAYEKDKVVLKQMI